MSSDTPSSPPPAPTLPAYLLNLLVAAGLFLLFLVILYVAYLPNRPAPIDSAAIQARQQRLAELRAKEQEMLTTYGITDPAKPTYRIPVERAMELIVNEHTQTP